MPMLQFDPRGRRAFGDESHIDLGDQCRIKLPVGAQLPSKHDLERRLPIDHVAGLTRRTILSDRVPPAADLWLDDVLFERRLEGGMGSRPQAWHSIG